MIKVVCHTNLDLWGEEWPDELPAIPNVGDEIQSGTSWNNGFQLNLQVVKVIWRSYVGDYGQYKWIPHIELSTTKSQNMLWSDNAAQGSIRAFYEWYAPKVGKTVGSFI